MIAGHLGTACYTVTTDNDLSLTSATNNAPLGLVWYSMTHGISDFGDFVGLKVKDCKTLAGTNMPGTFNYSLAFLNKCNSVNDGLGNVTELANKFGPECAIVGWGGAVIQDVAMTAAVFFFEEVKRGASVEEAVTTIQTRMGGTVAYLGNVPEQRGVQDAFKVFRNPGVIIDLK